MLGDISGVIPFQESPWKLEFCLKYPFLKPNFNTLLNLSSWCLVMVERLFLAVPRGCLQFVIVVFPDHTHLLFLIRIFQSSSTTALFMYSQ